MKDYSLFLEIKNQSFYKDEFSKEIKKGFLDAKKDIYKRTRPCEYENRYKEMLLEYLTDKTSLKDKDKKNIYIPKLILSDYFVSSSEELDVALFIRSLMNNRHSTRYIISRLKDWDDWNLKKLAISQIWLSLDEAKKCDASNKYCRLIACLVIFKEYYTPLERIIKDFFSNYGTTEMFTIINEYRTESTSSIDINTETDIDNLYNWLIEKNKNNIDNIVWYNDVIKSQEDRIKNLVSKGYIKRASKIKCWSKMEGKVHIISREATDKLLDYAQINPEKFLTEWVFIINKDTNNFELQNGIKSLFDSADNLKDFIDNAQKEKPSDVLSSMSKLIDQYFINSPLQQNLYPFSNFYPSDADSRIVFDAISKN